MTTEKCKRRNYTKDFKRFIGDTVYALTSQGRNAADVG
jgi:hypothetical protein